MSKKEKIGIGLVILIILFLSIFFLVTNNILKEKDPIIYQNKITLTPNIQSSEKKVDTAVLEINNEKYESEIENGVSVYAFMDKLRQEGKINFVEKKYSGIGVFIEEINGLKGNGNKYWIYYVNDKEAQIGVSNYKLKPGDVVSWKYEKNKY